MRAIEESIKMRATRCKLLLECPVNRLHIGSRVESKRNAPLIADNDHPLAGPIQARNRFCHTWQDLKFGGRFHILPFGKFPI